MIRSRRPRVSAGLLLYRQRAGGPEVFLAHPGGPFFARKDQGHWTIPKGEPEEGEELLAAAQREFGEETGFVPGGPFIDLGTVLQNGGKTVYAWGCEGEVPEGHSHSCNTFSTEWPIGSGKFQAFPEIDQACFFPISEARLKLKETQIPFLDRLILHLEHSEKGSHTKAPKHKD